MNKHKVKDLYLRMVVFISLAMLLFTTCSLEGDIETMRKKAGLVDTEKWITNTKNNVYITHVKDSVYHTAVGAGKDVAVVFAVAHRFTPDQLEALGVTGVQLTKISFMPAESQATYSVRVWIGGSANDGSGTGDPVPAIGGSEIGAPAPGGIGGSAPGGIGGSASGNIFNSGTLVYSGPELSGSKLKLREWNEVTLTTPVTIPSNQEIWIGYHINTQRGYPAATDAGPNFDKFGNLIFLDNNWQTLNNTLPYNWMLRGFTETIVKP